MIATAAKDGFLSRVLGARETGLVLIILTLVVVLSFASLHFPTWTNMRAHGDGALGRGDRRRRHDDPPDLGRDP